MKKYLKMIRYFHFKSVFFKYYFLFALIVALSTTLLSIYIYRVYFQNYTHEQTQSMESFLRQTEEHIDDSLDLLTESVHALSQRAEIVQMVILPKKDTTALSFTTTSLLQEAADTFRYYDRIILYESTTGKILQTTGSSEDASASGMTPLIQYCLDDKNWYLIKSVDNRIRCGLVIYGSEIYLCQHFISGSSSDTFLGTLLVRLTLSPLFDDLSSMLSDSPYSLSIQSPERLPIFQYKNEANSDSAVMVIENISSYSGWNFVLSKSGKVDYSLLRYLQSVFPFFLFFLLFGLLVSFILAFHAYRPVHNMIVTVSGDTDVLSREKVPDSPSDAESGSRSAVPESEYDLLTRLYRKMQTDQQSTEQFIEQASPEFERSLLIRMLTQEPADLEIIRSQLTYLKSSLLMDDCYQCFLLYSDHPAESSHVVNIILQDQASSLAESGFLPQWGELRILRLDSTNLLLVAHYMSELSAARIRTYQEQFCTSLTAQLSDLDDRLLFAPGSISPSLTDIRQSYHEAREAMRKLLYYRTDDAGSGLDAPMPEGSPEINDQYFQSQMNLLDDYLLSGNLNLGRSLTFGLLQEICFTRDGISASRRWCVDLFNILIRHTIQPEEDNTRLGQVYQDLERRPDQQSLYLFMVSETEKLLDKAEQLQNNRQYQLVLGAKEYIRQHYTDSALSLQQIADSSGISNTYLSTLFSDYAGENVISYLNNYRVEAAKDLLINTRIIIKEIGFRTGFNTVQNFNRVFKKVTGITPGDYRKQNSSL